MLSYADAVEIVWIIAASEAHGMRHEYIEKEHILIGMCKAHELSQDVLSKLMGKRVKGESINQEMLQVIETLERCGIQPKQLRRQIRRALGKGNHEYKSGQVYHRSEACRTYFRKAEELARKQGAAVVRPVQLLEALMRNPGEDIKKILGECGITPGEILEELKKRPGKRRSFQRHSPTPFIDRFCSDLTARARVGALKPMIGRRQELLQVVRTLSLHEKNNPVLVGEAGVGKTAIVEGLAKRIVSGNIHPGLYGKRIVELNLGALVAGTKYRGEFEERIQGLIQEARNHPEVILFIDEIHTLVGAGGAQGALDASNIMKPVLCRGDISVIGATTLAEYNRYIAKDRALERRFQPITIEEPDEDKTLKILQGLKERYEREHGVRVRPEALKAVVELSARYLPYRRFPDKAVELLDKACVRIKVPTLSFIDQKNGTECDDINIIAQSPQSLVLSPDIVAEVVAEETGIPVGKLKEDQRKKLLNLLEILESRVMGQRDAIEKIVRVVRLSGEGLKDETRPMGAFLFLGPSGVGKTELCKALAEALFGSEDQLIRFDMSEYKERHEVAKLIGAPPGYVGYEQGGQLTEALRKKPYSVVLFDEIEKAHPEVFDIFLQLFDEGRITDAQGQTVNARNSIFLMTSNIGTSLWYREPIGFIDPKSENGKGVKESIRAKLKETFRPEFLNRLDEVVFFHFLDMDTIIKLAKRIIQNLRTRLMVKKIVLDISDQALRFIAEKGYDPRYGARHLERAIRNYIEIPVSEKLEREELASGQRVLVDIEGNDIVFLKDYGTQ